MIHTSNATLSAGSKVLGRRCLHLGGTQAWAVPVRDSDSSVFHIPRDAVGGLELSCRLSLTFEPPTCRAWYSEFITPDVAVQSGRAPFEYKPANSDMPRFRFTSRGEGSLHGWVHVALPNVELCVTICAFAPSSMLLRKQLERAYCHERRSHPSDSGGF